MGHTEGNVDRLFVETWVHGTDGLYSSVKASWFYYKHISVLQSQRILQMTNVNELPLMRPVVTVPECISCCSLTNIFGEI